MRLKLNLGTRFCESCGTFFFLCIKICITMERIMMKWLNYWWWLQSIEYVSTGNQLGSLTDWGRVTHICFNNLTILVSDKCLSPDRRQAIIWTNAWILLIGPLGSNFSEMLIKIHTFSFNKMYSKMSSGKRRSFCLSLNVLILLYPVRIARGSLHKGYSCCYQA